MTDDLASRRQRRLVSATMALRRAIRAYRNVQAGRDPDSLIGEITYEPDDRRVVDGLLRVLTYQPKTDG